MLAARRYSSGLFAVALVALSCLVTCSSSKAEDGDSCGKNLDCASARCTAGVCEGSDCMCEGSDCRGRSSCRDGWLCTRTNATTFDAIPQCRQQCGGASGSCPADKHCDNGICLLGPEPFGLSWLNIPRAVPCAPKVPCEYKVKAPDSVTVDTYSWSFGDAPPVETKEPTTTMTYDLAGTYSVLVRARASSGAVAELRTTEDLCVGGVGAACDPSGSPCCEGSCSVLLVCK